jgi:predicted nucleic acid-binding protein
MTAKEKAHQIYDNMYNVESDNIHNMKKEDAIQCALIAVDEILNINSVDKDFSLSHYWLDVKDEILNL